MGLITPISAAAINLSVLWDPEVWGQTPPVLSGGASRSPRLEGYPIATDTLKAIKAHTPLRLLRHR